MATPYSSPAAVLASYKDLTPELRLCADDIVCAYRAARPTFEHVKSSMEDDRVSLWRRVFRPGPPRLPPSIEEWWPALSRTRGPGSWDTSQPIPQRHPFRRFAHVDLRTPVGVFSRDLPPSKCAKRKAPKRSESGTKAPSRKKGKTAYLQARPHHLTGDVEWFWSDSYGKGADPIFVQLMDIETRDPWSLEFAQATALTRHDILTVGFTDITNQYMAADWMRRRLVRVLGRGSGQRPTDPCREDFAALEKAQLLAPVVLGSPQTSKALKKWIEEQRKDLSVRREKAWAELWVEIRHEGPFKSLAELLAGARALHEGRTGANLAETDRDSS